VNNHQRRHLSMAILVIGIFSDKATSMTIIFKKLRILRLSQNRTRKIPKLEDC
jgi:hypothetical protein